MIEIEVPFEGRLDEQSGTRLAAGAMVRFIVRANHQIVDGEAAPQDLVHSIQFPTRLISTGQAWLVAGDDQDEAGFLELAQRWLGFLLHFELLESQRSDLVLRTGLDLV